MIFSFKSFMPPNGSTSSPNRHNPPIHFDKKDNVLARSNYFIGDVDKGMEQAETIVKGTYKTPIVQHCHIENPISYAYMEKDRIVVVTSTQIPHIVRRVIGQALGIPWGNVRVIKPYISGVGIRQ